MTSIPAAVITGASGFVGTALRKRLPDAATLSLSGDDWLRSARGLLEGRVVYHLAARTHEIGGGAEQSMQRDNAEKTRCLAQEARRQGALRIVFLSTAKVYGEESAGRPFTPGDAPAPADAYARSKLEGERSLASQAGPPDWVVVRSPLVFGARAGGNLGALLRLADSALPLPFAAVEGNRRSFVHVDDLARLLEACAGAPAAAGSIIHAVHPDAFSTARLMRALRRSLGRPERLFRVEPHWLEAFAPSAAMRARVRRLTRSFELDATMPHDVPWLAQVSFEQAVEDLARGERA